MTERMPHLKDPHQLDRAILAALVVIGFVLRAWQINLVHFGIDEATTAAIALQIGHAKYFPLTGVETSFGFHNPPLMFYLFAPVFAVFRDPAVALYIIAGLGAIAPLFVARAARLLSSEHAGLAAAAILAFCPNAIEHSRRLWGHDLVIFCAAVAFWGAIEAHYRRAWRFLAFSFVAAIFGQALHLSGILLWIPSIVALVASRYPVFAEPIDPEILDDDEAPPEPIHDVHIPFGQPALVVALVAFAIVYTPWVLNEFTNEFPDMQAIVAHLSAGSGGHDLGLPVAPHAAWSLVLGDFWNNDLLGAMRPFMLSHAALYTTYIVTALALLFLAVAIVGAIQIITRGAPLDRGPAWMLLLGILVPGLVFAGLFRASVPPYMLPALVPAVLGASWFLDRFESKAIRFLVFLSICIYAAASSILVVETRRHIAAGEGTSIPLAEKKAVVQLIGDLRDNQQFYVFQDNRDRSTGVDYAYAYLLYWGRINEHVPANPASAGISFVVVDHRTILHPLAASYLDDLSAWAFAHQTVYVLSPKQQHEWRDLLDRIHPPPATSP